MAVSQIVKDYINASLNESALIDHVVQMKLIE